MTITLTPDQIRWLEGEIKAGRIRSLEEGVRWAVAELMRDAQYENDDLTWAKPLVDNAVAELDQGSGISLDEAKNKLDAHLRKIGVR